MRVLHVYRTYYPDPPGGLQEAIRQIALATTACGVENTIFTLSPHPTPKVLERPEATVVRCRSWMAPASCDLGGIDAIKTFSRLCAEADLIHAFFPWPYADLLDLFSSSGKPLVVSYISDIVRQRFLGKLYEPLMWRTLKRASAIVANAPSYVATSPVLSSPLLHDKVRVIPLGIDEQSYSANADPGILERLGLQVGEPFFLFIGALRYYKGLFTLLEAAQAVDVPIVIAGTGPEEFELRKKQMELGLARVLFAGQVSENEKIALLQHCHVFVLPSHLRSEAFGMVLVEAAMFGKPLISCEIGTGTSFINVDGETGIVVEPSNVGALAHAMNRLSAQPALAASMGAAARTRYEKLFSAQSLGREYTALFRDVLVRKRGKSS